MTPSTHDAAPPRDLPFFADCPAAQELHTLTQAADTNSTVFQSVLVSAIRILDGVYYEEQQLAYAAISLAQKRKLADMVARVRHIRFSLRALLNAQGSRILHLQENAARAETLNVSWWFYLTTGIETLKGGIDWIGSMISGQPPESPARALSDIIAGLLRSHYDELLKEAEHWLMVEPQT